MRFEEIENEETTSRVIAESRGGGILLEKIKLSRSRAGPCLSALKKVGPALRELEGRDFLRPTCSKN